MSERINNSYLTTNSTYTLANSDDIFKANGEISVTELIAVLHAMDQKAVALHNQLNSAQKEAAVQQQRDAFQTKREGIAKQRNAEVLRGVTEIVGGALNVAGGFAGASVGAAAKDPLTAGAAQTQAQAATALLGGFGRSIEGAAKPWAASITEDSQLEQLNGDFTEKVARQNEEVAAQALQTAESVRQKSKDTAHELSNGYVGYMASVVKG